ncbi:hypothetical protein AVEN_1943-1 [Araneus ventricosus]|uniref:Uncharacterized protein n=1 Tax=Araneus ventricosus TaxID=182803 RepID=A0A4Y2GCZ8_ARAVE|nr:hypothetical protein AVEN_1943-1 [Araneus ventricosus]
MAFPGATSNSGWPARYSVGMARSIIGGSKYLFSSSSTYFQWATSGHQTQGVNCSSIYSGGLPRASSRKASAPIHPKSSLSLTGTPAIRTYYRSNGQHCLCHRYSIAEAVFLLSKVSQSLWW